MSEEEKFWYKKCFANNRNDSRINKILYSVKLEAQYLDFTFSIVLNLEKVWNGILSVSGEERGAEGEILADKSC